jgi:predicted RNA-binding Zn ribbon-like protein
VELMNTVWADRHGVHDALADLDDTRAWLHAVSDRLDLLPPVELDASQPGAERLSRRLRRLRDALRRLAAEATVDPRSAAAPATVDLDTAVAVVNETAGAAPRWSALTWSPGTPPSRQTRTGGSAADAAVSAIAEEAVHLFTDLGERLLRACLAPGCVLYFVKDHPRREWCSTACGNRARAARHYHRHRRPSP